MKKFFTAVMMCAALALALSAQSVIIRDSFEVNFDGWTNAGDYTQLTAVNGAGYNFSRGMMVTERKSPDDGAVSDKGFYVDGGETYNYSVYVRHTGSSLETFNLTLSWFMPDVNTYGSKVIAAGTAVPNKWTPLTAAYATPKGSLNPTFFITTNSTIDFYFDEFVITGRNTNLTKMTAAASTPANVGLKDIYASHFRVGNILNGTTANSTNIQNLIRLEYNSVTAENEHKPDATMSRTNSTNTNIRAVFNIGAARIMEFCVRHNIPMRGHVLFWHGQTPQWFFLQNVSDATDYRNHANSAIPWASAATMNSRIDSYTQNLFALYRTQYPALNLYAYDVVNEFVRVSGTAGPRLPGFDLEGAGGAGAAPGNSPWQAIYGNTNTSWVRTCFEAARRHAPAHTKLFYNDYNEFDPTKRDYIINTFLRPLYTAGLLDGMGMQGHISADPSTTHWSNLNRYREAMTRYAQIGPGFEVQITELDVVTNQGSDTDNSNFLSNQPNVYRAIFEHAIAINADPAMGNFTAICMWGPDDGNSWITRRAGRTNAAPLLHDRNLNRKPAYDAVAGIVPQPQWGDGNNPTFGNNSTLPVCDPVPSGFIFLHTFEDGCGVQGWTGRGAASAAVSSAQKFGGERSLMASGRTAEWNGAALSLSTAAFVPGSSYSFSVMALYDDGRHTMDIRTDTIQLTMQYDLRDTTRYAQVAVAQAENTQWVQLANTSFAIPAGASNVLLYVEMPRSLHNFYIDNASAAAAGRVINPNGTLGGQTNILGSNNARHTQPLIAVRGRTLAINALDGSEVNIRIVNLSGRTVASFNANGRSNLSLRKIPAGSYIVEARRVKDGKKMVSNVVLR
ncbi:MAG: endo-1,4-beta-xylanase [Chitinispirillia bacterium]|nr:endo-1,4-beta-xylanase [Chitinispirillia bacterium]